MDEDANAVPNNYLQVPVHSSAKLITCPKPSIGSE